jgi:hypothetical protein
MIRGHGGRKYGRSVAEQHCPICAPDARRNVEGLFPSSDLEIREVFIRLTGQLCGIRELMLALVCNYGADAIVYRRDVLQAHLYRHDRDLLGKMPREGGACPAHFFLFGAALNRDRSRRLFGSAHVNKARKPVLLSCCMERFVTNGKAKKS